MLEALKIVRIRALTNFYSNDGTFLSFIKGQEFYSIGIDRSKHLYFVTTEYSTPFSNTAICGHVPLFYFVEIVLGTCKNITYFDIVSSTFKSHVHHTLCNSKSTQTESSSNQDKSTMTIKNLSLLYKIKKKLAKLALHINT